MAIWTNDELAELGPGLRGFVEASAFRNHGKQYGRCVTCGEPFGSPPGTRSRHCPACRPEAQRLAVREGMRRLRRQRKSTSSPSPDRAGARESRPAALKIPQPP